MSFTCLFIVISAKNKLTSSFKQNVTKSCECNVQLEH